MPVRPIRLFGDPVLTTPAQPVTTFDKELRNLVRDLAATMVDAPGVGLAAPQIGVGVRVFTYEVEELSGHVVNPVLHVVGDDDQEAEEGCLSLPGLSYPTVRKQTVVATGFDMYGEPVVVSGSDLLARCIQHEVDHLDGVLFIDRLDPERRVEALRAIRDAEWFGSTERTVKLSPHATNGLAI